MSKSHCQVVFISTTGIGNLVPTVEFAEHLTNRAPARLSATVLVTTLSERPLVNDYIKSRASTSRSVNFVFLPPVEPPAPDSYRSSLAYISLFVQSHRAHVKQALAELKMGPAHLSGLFVDMFTTSMIDVGNELDVPCYHFFASPASFLGLMLHLPSLDAQLGAEFAESASGFIEPKEPGTLLVVPGFASPLPPSVMPTLVLKRKEDGYAWLLHHARRHKETKGIVLNTVKELETYAVDSISEMLPIYTVGPVLDLCGPVRWHPEKAQCDRIVRWLDGQPDSSVVFLCFGSMGRSVAQLREIAAGLERARVRYLWSIREPPKGNLELPGEYRNMEEILPHGFLDRSLGLGLVCGWVPQVTVLAHRAIGGFVSHCGWNSILESLWYGVPIATWPLYAEQQMNAFMMVKELGLAIEIRLDYRGESSTLVSAEELERGLKRLMDGDSEVRRKVKDMSETCRNALMEGGSSFASLGSLIEELTAKAC